MARALKNDNLVNNTLETELINGQQYVTTKESARYYGMKHKTLIHLIAYDILKTFKLRIRVMLR